MRTAGESRELVQLRPVTVRGPSRRWSPCRSAARTNAPGARPRRLPYASPRLGREQTNASITHGREFPPLGTRPHNAGPKARTDGIRRGRKCPARSRPRVPALHSQLWAAGDKPVFLLIPRSPVKSHLTEPVTKSDVSLLGKTVLWSHSLLAS